jgi:hypothetical protein
MRAQIDASCSAEVVPDWMSRTCSFLQSPQ